MTEEGVRRIEALLDPGTFAELDHVARAPDDEAVVGQGAIDGRDVAVYCLEPATLGEVAAAKIVKVQELALRCRVPIVGLIGSAAEGPDRIAALAGRAEVLLRQVRSSGIVPQLGVVGAQAGSGELGWAVLADFVVQAADRARLEEEVRALLSHLPAHCDEPPPYVSTADPADRGDPELQELVADRAGQPYDVREVVARLLDDRRFLEVRADVGPSILVGLGRLGGHAAGIVANRPSGGSGAIDAPAAAKAARFIRTCDAFGLPLVTLVDAPDEALDCAAPDRAKLAYAYGEASVPKLAVVTGTAAGEAYLLMSPKQMGVDLSLAWPTAAIGAADPYSAAERGYVDDVIEPRDTRRALVRGLQLCRHRPASGQRPGHGNIPL